MSKINVEKIVEYWKTGGQKDFKSAKAIFESTEEYVHSLFLLHLAIEKSLKSLYVKNHSKHAPFTHNLLYLSQQNQLNLDNKQKQLLAVVNEFNLACRYPDEKLSIDKKATKQFTQGKILAVEDLIQWILEKLQEK